MSAPVLLWASRKTGLLISGVKRNSGDIKNALTRCGYNTERAVAFLLDWIDKGIKDPTGPFDAFNGAEAAVLTGGKEEEEGQQYQRPGAGSRLCPTLARGV